MLVVIGWVLLFVWRATIDRREKMRRTVKTDEIERWRLVRKSLKRWTIGIGIAYVLAAATAWEARADAAAVEVVIAQCTERLHNAPLQDCLSAPLQKKLDNAGRAGKWEGIAWAIAIL